MNRFVSAALTLFVVILGQRVALAGRPQSVPLARELTALMANQRIGAIAARDPDSTGRFVAAIVFPGVQLLVVAARYPWPAVLQQRLLRRQYTEVFADLQATSIPESQVFFQAFRADGLHAVPEGDADVMYVGKARHTVCDGGPKRRDTSDAAYREKFERAEALYSRLLTLLIVQLHGSASGA